MLSVGNDNRLYYNSATAASPTWLPICIVGNVSLDINISEAEVDLRCSSWVMGLPAKLSGGINFTMARDIGGTAHDVLRGYALARTPKQYAIASGEIATSATQYLKAFMFFTAFPWNQETQNMAQGDCSLKMAWVEEPAGTLIQPTWVTVP